jgi:hypothetical protein
MDAVVFASRTGVTLSMTPVPPRAEDTEALEVWHAMLAGSGLNAIVVAPQAAWQPPPSLTAFLTALDESWKGWDGERVWQSAEGEIRLTARHDKTNTVLLRVEMEDGGPPRWSCTAELELDPGVFRGLAADARRLGATHQQE